MGDGMTNSAWDIFMYFVVFGGIPMLIVAVPVVSLLILNRVIRGARNRQGKTWKNAVNRSGEWRGK